MDTIVRFFIRFIGLILGEIRVIWSPQMTFIVR